MAGPVVLLMPGAKAEDLWATDGPLLLLFAGLFIVVAGFERALLSAAILDAVGHLHLDQVPLLTAVTGPCRICSAMCRRCCS